MKELTLEQRLSESQNEYFRLLFDMVNNSDGLITKDKGYTYWWEQLKERQLTVIHLADLKRFEALQKAKEALEQAFTPHIMELLEKSDVNI